MARGSAVYSLAHTGARVDSATVRLTPAWTVSSPPEPQAQIQPLYPWKAVQPSAVKGQGVLGRRADTADVMVRLCVRQCSFLKAPFLCTCRSLISVRVAGITRRIPS